MEPEGLVYADENGLKGSNFYWKNRERYNLPLDQLESAGVTDERVKIHKDLVKPLLEAERDFSREGYSIYIKEGYRSRALYHLVYESRRKAYSKENVDKILNIKDMPHATGRAVDIALMDSSNREVPMRNKDDDPDALIVDFYKGKTDPESQRFQELQEYLIQTMQSHGFQLGSLREYFHFNYGL